MQFTNVNLFEYASLCYLAASKCEKAVSNKLSEVHFLLLSARSYISADRAIDHLHVRSNANEYIEGALNCYNQAIALLNDDSVMKAALIREMKQIQPNCELTSNFVSPAHRINDLEMAANECILTADYIGALDKLTEIYDDITERKMEYLYKDVLQRNEISRIVLLLLLRLPPARQAPTNIQLLQKFDFHSTGSNDSPDVDSAIGNDAVNEHQTCTMIDSIGQLLALCKHNEDNSTILKSINGISKIPGITLYQQIVLKELKCIYQC